MALTLRPYQTQIIDQVRRLMKQGKRRILVCAPTGAGKTALTANMLGTSASKGMRSLFIVHRRELVKQSAMAFYKANVPHGIIARGFPETPQPPVQICSVQTLGRRLNKIKSPSLIVWDETHHLAAGTWEKIFNMYPKAYHIGLTATPERTDGKGLKKYFDDLVLGPSVEWLIDQRYLAPYKLFAPSNVDLSSVKKQMGDYKTSDLLDVIDKPTITGDAIREYTKVADGKRAVVFCVSVDHSKHVVDGFNRAGINACHVDGGSSVHERDQALEDFERGRIKVLSNVDLFGEGFDLPSIEVAILLRPTQSLGLYLQQVGRVLRTSPGKNEAIILDHVGNYERHGLPDDAREWSLDGKKGRLQNSKSDNTSIKICDSCFAAQPPGRSECKFCGHAFPQSPREIDEVEGELVEIDKQRAQRERKVEQARAQSFEDLVEIGKQRGYKRPYGWARHIWVARQRRKLAGGQGV